MTTQTVELDPETGLAALPEGYIWRVVSNVSYSNYLDIKLVRVDIETLTRPKWLFFGSEEYTVKTERVVMSDWFDVHRFIPARRTKENIAQGISELSEKMYREWKTKQDQFTLMRSLQGDYPPKNLNSV